MTRRDPPAAKPRRLMGLSLLAAAVVLVFAWRIEQRAEDYGDADRFWRHEVAANPRSSIAPSYLAVLSTTPKSTLQWLRLCHDNASSRGQPRDADQCLMSAVETLTNALLDAQVLELERVEQTLAQLLHRNASAQDMSGTAIIGGITLGFPRDAIRRAQILSANPGRAESDLAQLLSRRGRHQTAIQLAEDSLRACRRCRWTWPLAWVFAAAGQHQRALSILRGEVVPTSEVERIRQQVIESEGYFIRAQAATGPERVHAFAQSLLCVGRYGLAFETLRPEASQLLVVRAIAHDYALVAYRAGFVEVARSALLRHEQPPVVDEILGEWSKERPQLE
jgi:hypothetical protein